MKKIFYILMFSFSLSGCMFPRDIDEKTVLKGIRLVTESEIPYEEEKPETKTETILSEEEKTYQQESEFSDDVKAEYMRKQQNLFYFSNLDIVSQNVYVEILYALENYVEEMELSTLDTALVDKVFQCVLMDHPEIFYTDGYTFVKYALGEDVKKITFKGTYIYEGEEKDKREALIEENAMKMLQGIRADATDYEKVKYVYETIIENTEYNILAQDNQNICSVFLNGESVCQGYAKAVQYLLTKLNIPATLVIGTVENGEGHAWNLVKVDNEYYYLDTTWGDASYLFQSDAEPEERQNTSAINYDYLCVTTEEIERTHSLGNMVSLPVCDSMNANYYVREGAYFTDWDENQLEKLICSYREQGRECVTLRCGDETIYKMMIEELIQNQRIFHYISGENDSIFYTDSPKQLSITFWL